MFGEGYKWQILLLNFLKPLSPFPLLPNILLSNLYSDSLPFLRQGQKLSFTPNNIAETVTT
jgi:hypothetical protein